MASGAEAVIYLANQRGCAQADWFRSYYTFNFGEFKRESRTPFGSLIALNEHTLKEGRTLSFTFTEKIKVLLLPVEGELIWKLGTVENVVDVGQAAYIAYSPGRPLELTNPYTSRLINFLQVCIRVDSEFIDVDQTCSFNVDSDNSEIIPLTESASSDVLFYIGKFRGRQEVAFQPRRQGNGIFVYEIAGTCEVHERLLLPGDALALKSVEIIELEALTHEAIVLIAEVPTTS